MNDTPPAASEGTGSAESGRPIESGTDGAPAEVSGDALPLIAYRLPGTEDDAHPIVTAPTGRAWMRDTDKQFAHRCLPLLMANQAGWLLLNPYPLEVVWDGGRSNTGLRVTYTDGAPSRPSAISLFGYGILTWSVDYLFRTPPGYNLSVRGPANMPRDGIQPLEGLVETDWAVATFTMNWKLTRPNHPIAFEAGEPFCMVVPQRRHELERFEPRIVPIADEPELEAQWGEFQRRRLMMAGLRRIAVRRAGRPALDRIPFERHYFEGKSPGGWSAREHQTKLALKGFRPAREASEPSDP